MCASLYLIAGAVFPKLRLFPSSGTCGDVEPIRIAGFLLHRCLPPRGEIRQLSGGRLWLPRRRLGPPDAGHGRAIPLGATGGGVVEVRIVGRLVVNGLPVIGQCTHARLLHLHAHARRSHARRRHARRRSPLPTESAASTAHPDGPDTSRGGRELDTWATRVVVVLVVAASVGGTDRGLGVFPRPLPQARHRNGAMMGEFRGVSHVEDGGDQYEGDEGKKEEDPCAAHPGRQGRRTGLAFRVPFAPGGERLAESLGGGFQARLGLDHLRADAGVGRTDGGHGNLGRHKPVCDNGGENLFSRRACFPRLRRRRDLGGRTSGRKRGVRKATLIFTQRTKYL